MIDHEFHFAVEKMQKGHQLTETLASVGRVEQPIELWNGGAEPARELAAARA